MTLTNIKLVVDSTVTHSFQPCGTAYTVSYKPSADAAAVTASVPASGSAVTLTGTNGSFVITPSDTRYHLTGALANGTRISVSSSGLLVAEDGASITPIFVYDSNGRAPFSVSNVSYWDWDTAMSAAGTSGTVVLTDDYTLPAGNYEVPSGVTLVLPYASGKTSIEGSGSSKFPYANYTLVNGTNADLDPQTDLYLTLTVPRGATVTNRGTISVGGTVDGVSKRNYAGVCSGSHCNIQLDGTLSLAGNSVLSVVGYIIGDGTVETTSTGAKIYQLYSVLDFYGGSYCLAVAGDANFLQKYAVDHFDGEDLIIAYNRFAMLSIQTTIELDYGNFIYGYCDLYANSDHNQTVGCMVGTSGSLIQLSSGATLTVTYDPDTHVAGYYSGTTVVPLDKVGKTTLTVTGGASLGSASLTVDVTIVKIEMDSADMTVNIPYNYDIELLNGTYTVGNDMSLLPGAGLTVGSGATLNVSSRLNVYAGLLDLRSVSSKENVTVTHANFPTVQYPTTEQLQDPSFGGNGSANLIVDGGTLNLDSGAKLAGLVQTTGKGTLTVNSGASVSGNKYQFGATGSTSALTYKAYVAGACLFTENGSIIDPATGAVTTLQTGTTYTATEYSSAIGSYSYKLYTSSASTSTIVDCTDPLGAAVQGAWYTGTLATGTTDSASAVAKVTGSGTTYYSSLAAAVAAARDGDTVELLKDITLAQPVSSHHKITIDLGAHNVTCTNGLLAHSGKNAVTLKLGSGTITDGSASNIPMLVNCGTLTLDTGTATVNWGTGVTCDIGTQVIANYGTMTLTGSGSIRFTDKSDGLFGTSYSGIFSEGALTRFASVVYNRGTLTVSGDVKLDITGGFIVKKDSNGNDVQTTTTFCAAVLNQMGDITALGNVTITGGEIYAVYNLGGHIGEISGGSYSGYYGIENRNVRGNDVTRDASDADYIKYDYFILSPAVIEKIDGLKADATIYALYNRGTIGTICGETELTATRYALYNAATWYYTSEARYYESVADTTYGDSGRVLKNYGYVSRGSDFSKLTGDWTAVLDSSGEPLLEICSIGSIEGNAKIATTGTTNDNNSSYALVSTGYIGKIGGSAELSSAYRYALQLVNGGFLGTLTDSAYVHASNAYALEVSGSGTAKCYDYRDSDNQQCRVDYEYTPSRLESIDGDGVRIESAGSYAMNITGEVGSIGGTVNISAASTAISVGGTTNKTRVYTRNWDGSTETDREDDYTYRNGLIEAIGASADDKVTVTVTGDTGIYVTGQIDLIGPGTTVEAGRYAIHVADSRISAQDVTITTEVDSNDSSMYLTKYARRYTHTQAPTIKKIDDATLRATRTDVNGYTLRNYGCIGMIENADISTPKAYAIYNYPEGAYSGTRDTFNWYRGTSRFGTSYAQFNGSAPTYGTVTRMQAEIGTIKNCTVSAESNVLVNEGGKIGSIEGSGFTATNGERAISNAGRMVVSRTYSYTEPVYNASSDTNYKFYTTTTSSTATYGAQPVIEKLGGGNTLSAKTNTLINYGIVNAVGDAEAAATVITATNGVALYNLTGTQYTDGTYHSASIGTIRNVQAVGTSYGILNGNASASYPEVTIGSIGEGTVAVATSAKGYGLYNSKLATISELAAGDFRGGNGDRAYAVGNAGSLTYADGKSLSTVTRTASANDTDYVCYFVTGKLVAAIARDGGDSAYYTTLAEAVSAANGALITMLDDTTEGAITTSGTVVLDLAGHTVSASITATTLYGMDSTGSYTVNADYSAKYTLPTGKIIGTVNGLAKVYQTAADGSYTRYVAITDDNSGTTTFHPFNISITGFRALLSQQEDGSYAAAFFYRAVARGDSAVQSAVTSSGFVFDSANVETQYSGSGTQITMDKELESTIGWGGILDADNMQKQYGAQAFLTFENGGTQLSEARSASLFDLLVLAYKSGEVTTPYADDTTREPEVILAEAMESIGLLDKWNQAIA